MESEARLSRTRACRAFLDAVQDRSMADEVGSRVGDAT